jgi:purine catabolism regulator
MILDFTVRDMLKLEVLRNLKIVAGYRGLDKKVTSISFLDAPDAVNWIRGHEFIVTTLYLFRDTENQLKLINYLAEKNVSALGIKLKRFVHDLSAEVIELANCRLLPLIIIPYEKAWIDLINPIMAELLNRQLVYLEKSNSIRKLFTQVVLEGGELQSIAKLLSEFTHRPITIIELTNKNTFTWPSNFERRIEQQNLSLILKNDWYKNIENIKNVTKNIEGLLVPIEVAKQVEGFIIVWKTEELKGIDLNAVEHAITVTALHIQHLKAVNEINQRFKDDFISHLLQGEYSTSYIKEKAKEMGWAIADKNLVAAARIMSVNSNENWEKNYEIFNYFRDVLKRYIPLEILMGMNRNNTIIFILTGNEENHTLDEMVDLICSARLKLMTRDQNLRIGLGIGAVCNTIELVSQSYEEALTACKLSITLGKVCYYEELGSYSLLVELLNFKETEVYLKRLIYPIIDYDRGNNTELFKTLETFIYNNCNYREAAKKLFVHHNTIRYRLEIINKLINADLKKPENILNLMLGIKLFNLKS